MLGWLVKATLTESQMKDLEDELRSCHITAGTWEDSVLSSSDSLRTSFSHNQVEAASMPRLSPYL